MDEEELTAEEAKERKIMKLLLKVKNGTPPQRKSALRQLTDKARDLGAGPLFNQILPLLMSPTLEDQERHLLVKVRIAFFFTIATAVQSAQKLRRHEPGRLAAIALCRRPLPRLHSTHLSAMELLATEVSRSDSYIWFGMCVEEHVIPLSEGSRWLMTAMLTACRSLTASCTSWTSWSGRSCTRSLSSSSRCSSMRTTTHVWKVRLRASLARAFDQCVSSSEWQFCNVGLCCDLNNASPSPFAAVRVLPTGCLITHVHLLIYVLSAGREIIANLSKAAGLATMIAAMRPDIDNIDEYVRNTTARAFSVVASALGVPALLPFLKAVCLSKKSWQVRPLPRLAFTAHQCSLRFLCHTKKLRDQMHGPGTLASNSVCNNGATSRA